MMHQTLAAGRWFTLTLAEQLGNIGSEVSRAILGRNDPERFKRLKEIARARTLLRCCI
jgi:hypothetical protein